jgi:CheY-like chemotaxis protein
MTANAFSKDKDKCFEAGMISLLSEPIKVGELKSAFKHEFTKK